MVFHAGAIPGDLQPPRPRRRPTARQRSHHPVPRLTATATLRPGPRSGERGRHDASATPNRPARHSTTPTGTCLGSAMNHPRKRTVHNWTANPNRLWSRRLASTSSGPRRPRRRTSPARQGRNPPGTPRTPQPAHPTRTRPAPQPPTADNTTAEDSSTQTRRSTPGSRPEGFSARSCSDVPQPPTRPARRPASARGTAQPRQRARSGRSATTEPSRRRTRRVRARDQTRSTPSQSGSGQLSTREQRSPRRVGVHDRDHASSLSASGHPAVQTGGPGRGKSCCSGHAPPGPRQPLWTQRLQRTSTTRCGPASCDTPSAISHTTVHPHRGVAHQRPDQSPAPLAKPVSP